MLPTRSALESFIASEPCLVWKGSQSFRGDPNPVKPLGVFLVFSNALF
jgi:hypothetical protein